MTNKYETVFILTSVLSNKKAGQVASTIEGYLNENKADVMYKEYMGLRKLAYEIKKNKSGYYYLYQYEASATLIKDFNVFLKRNESVLRSLTIKMDKHHEDFEQKRQAKKSAEPTPEEETAEVASTDSTEAENKPKG